MQVRRALVLAMLPLLVAGCSEDEPKPKMPDPTTPSSSSSSPTAEPTQEQESPEDFIRRWQAASDQAQLTGDTEPYRSMTEGCEPCDGFAGKVEDIYKAGGRIEFAGSEVLLVESDGSSGKSYTVRIESPEAIIVPSKGSPPNRLAGGRLTLRVFLKAVKSSWTVRHYTIVPTA